MPLPSLPRLMLQWFKAIVKHIALTITGVVFSLGFLLWGQFGWLQGIPNNIFAGIAILCFLVAFFKSWRDEWQKREEAESNLKQLIEDRDRNIPTVLLDFHHSGGLMWLDEHAPTLRTDKGTVLNVFVFTIQEENCQISFPIIPSLGTTPVPLSPIVSWPDFKGAVQSAQEYFAQALYNRCREEPETRDISFAITYRISKDLHAMTEWIVSIRRLGANVQVREVKHYKTAPLMPLKNA